VVRDRRTLAKTLDLACLKPPVTLENVLKTIDEAVKEGCASVCAPSLYAETLIKTLKGSKTKSCVVTGFPFGYGVNQLDEVKTVVDLGVQEVDFVVDYHSFLSGNLKKVSKDIQSIVAYCETGITRTKAILETCYLKPHEIHYLGKLCHDFGVDWLKTSTGFGPSGASIESVGILLKLSKNVKASGGIKTPETANLYLDMGCTRLGVGSLQCLPG
jgi:deoxyribose-phosphate aldolase